MLSFFLSLQQRDSYSEEYCKPNEDTLKVQIDLDRSFKYVMQCKGMFQSFVSCLQAWCLPIKH